MNHRLHRFEEGTEEPWPAYFGFRRIVALVTVKPLDFNYLCNL
jgi:hypothetical protein